MIDDETSVIKDITKWREQVTVPTFDGLDGLIQTESVIRTSAVRA